MTKKIELEIFEIGEKLPEKDRFVLARERAYKAISAEWHKLRFHGEPDVWIDTNGDEFEFEITHWCKLPDLEKQP